MKARLSVYSSASFHLINLITSKSTGTLLSLSIFLLQKEVNGPNFSPPGSSSPDVTWAPCLLGIWLNWIEFHFFDLWWFRALSKMSSGSHNFSLSYQSCICLVHHSTLPTTPWMYNSASPKGNHSYQVLYDFLWTSTDNFGGHKSVL